MGNVKDRQFWESARYNNASFTQYYNRFVEIAVSMFEWKNIPESVDPRYLELCLFSDGKAVFFYDEVLGYLTLRCAIGGPLSVYRIPINRRAYANNGYQKQLSDKDSVIIFNNFLHTNSMLDVELFAKRLYNIDRTIDVNVNAQKTPILISCDETQRLTLKNAYMKYEGNEPVIYADKGFKNDALAVLKTDAPYVADKLYTLKSQLYNEVLTYFGISNTNTTKKERLITDEVNKNQGGVMANRYSRLMARKQACDEINRMFGLNIDVEYREDFNISENDIINEVNVDE